jgi:uncharacterized membrane protein YphA (DoxX/SURF4 family)
MYFRALCKLLFLGFLFFTPAAVLAHEAYVLTPMEVQSGIQTPAFNGIATAFSNLSEFVFWGFIAVLVVGIVFFISTIRPLERRLDPLFARGRRYAVAVVRITIGISFLAAAYYSAAYGPELSLAATFGAAAEAVKILLVIMGILLIIGFYTRIVAFASLVLFGYAVYAHGAYMLTYANYLGGIIVLLILGSHHGVHPRTVAALARARRHLLGLANWVEPLAKKLAPYSFALLRICFGISLLYASFYAKILHNNLALQVASLPRAGHTESLAYAFGFEPHFLVLGAAIIEMVIAIFFILGIEIRFISLFLLFWLSLSLWYFGEAVWPHIILIGIPIAFMLYGYDRYSLEGRFFKRGGREPVL